MIRELTDNTGASVTIEVVGEGSVRSYAARLADSPTPAGRADFVDAADEHTRIFFHTEVGREFHGRGLAGLLIRSALADAIEENTLVVPVCRSFAGHLRTNGDAFIAQGGRFRAPRPADLAVIGRAVRA